MTELRRHVLLVEDSDTQAFKFAALMEAEGFSVSRCPSAEDAVEFLNSNIPDIIVVDYHLPGMEGDEFCRLIRLNTVIEPIPILILTDDAKPDTERQGLDSGADDHITKSTDSDVMVARIHALMRKPRSELLPAAGGMTFRVQRLLLVDDSPTYLAFLESELAQEGYRVQTANGGREALEAMNKNAFDCIIVDLIMPEIDGIELCRRFDNLRRSSNLSFPLLMVTGHDSKDEMMRALEAGADDFVSKASDVVVVKARVRALLRRKMLRDEHERIISEFRRKELEVIRERAAKETAQLRAELVEELENTNRELAARNQELHDTQLQLVQSAKMASLGELVAGIAHEVNNPLAFSLSHLSSIAKWLGEISARAADKLDERSRSRLEKARLRAGDAITGLERVRDLVIKLRTFSRLDEGDFKWADMAECIDSTLALLEYKLGQEVRFVTRFADDNRLYCAPGALNQVVMNIVSNAIDALDGKGEIEVATERDRQQFRITVTDNGPGIPDRIKERIFEPFFTTKDVGSGTGLGLAISYKIVERHRGELRVRDREGGGAVFEIMIPTELEE
ncbi:MAG: response regulator [Rhodospirillales bacterium]